MNQLKTLAVAGFLAATVFPPLPSRFPAPARRSPIRSMPNGRTPTKKTRASSSTINRSAQAAASSKSKPKRSPSARPMRRSKARISKVAAWSSSRWSWAASSRWSISKGSRRELLVLDGHTREDFSRRDEELGRSGDQEAQSRREAALAADRRRSPLRWFRHHLQFHLLSVCISPDWKSKVGSATSVEWPVGIGAKGNEGVSNNVSQTKGSIGYVEYAYALQNKNDIHKMVNKDGKTVTPTSALPGRRRQRRLEFRAGLRRDPGQRAGRRRGR